MFFRAVYLDGKTEYLREERDNQEKIFKLLRKKSKLLEKYVKYCKIFGKLMGFLSPSSSSFKNIHENGGFLKIKFE